MIHFVMLQLSISQEFIFCFSSCSQPLTHRRNIAAYLKNFLRYKSSPWLNLVICIGSAFPQMSTSSLHWPGEHRPCCITSPIRPYGHPLSQFHLLYSIQMCLVSITFSVFIISLTCFSQLDGEHLEDQESDLFVLISPAPWGKERATLQVSMPNLIQGTLGLPCSLWRGNKS